VSLTAKHNSDGPETAILFALEATSTLATLLLSRPRTEVIEMFKELTDELLDLTATTQGYRKAFLARSIVLCTTCTVRFQ
jgi:hypothetical protein